MSTCLTHRTCGTHRKTQRQCVCVALISARNVIKTARAGFFIEHPEREWNEMNTHAHESLKSHHIIVSAQSIERTRAPTMFFGKISPISIHDITVVSDVDVDDDVVVVVVGGV